LKSENTEAEAEVRSLFSHDYEALSHEALRVEREVILRLRNDYTINDEALRRIQHDLDLAEARLRPKPRSRHAPGSGQILTCVSPARRGKGRILRVAAQAQREKGFQNLRAVRLIS
jgi:hypothetical protein